MKQYRRPIEYAYDVAYLVADALAAANLHPEFLDIGGYVVLLPWKAPSLTMIQ